MDEDLETLTREHLIVEARRLRAGIREHRDSSGQELCWHHPKLWGLLPDASDPLPPVPAWPEFLRGCVQYRQSLDERTLPKAPGRPGGDASVREEPGASVSEPHALFRR